MSDFQKRHQPLARDAMAYVLAGGRGSRLSDLTDRRAKPAVHFGGKARIIDFALSNALNSGIRRIGVATPIRRMPLFSALDRAKSMIRALPPKWTAGLARLSVSSASRLPRPPAST